MTNICGESSMKGCERTSRRATLRARLRRPKPSPPVENSRRSAGRKLRWGGNQDASTRMLDSPGRPRENPPAWAPDKGARRVFPDRATGSRIGLPLKRRKSGSLAVPARARTLSILWIRTISNWPLRLSTALSPPNVIATANQKSRHSRRPPREARGAGSIPTSRMT
jgi:hypothetical protein